MRNDRPIDPEMCAKIQTLFQTRMTNTEIVAELGLDVSASTISYHGLGRCKHRVGSPSPITTILSDPAVTTVEEARELINGGEGS